MFYNFLNLKTCFKTGWKRAEAMEMNKGEAWVEKRGWNE